MQLTIQTSTPSPTKPTAGPAVAESARRVVVLANPYSGSGPNRRYVDRFIEALHAESLAPTVVWDPPERRRLLAACGDDASCRCVVAAGGDGSIADAINDMAAHGLLDRLPLATLPIGTENLFAREFGFTRRGADLAAAIAAGQTRHVDLGAVVSSTDEKLFTLMASAGFDAEVVRRMARWRCGGEANGQSPTVRRVNRLSYVPRILGCVREYAYPPITVEIDGERHTGSHLFVFNLPQYGGNLGIARHACGHDAMLDWVLFQRPGLVSLAGYGLTVLRARHLGRPDVSYGQATRLRITTDTPVAVQADGDPAGATPVDIEVRPCALRIISPDAPA